MMIPSIHLNGTSRDELVEQLIKAARSLRLAIEALGEATPNGRDYYVQGPSALHQARGEHRVRLGKLQDVYDELETLAEAIHSA